MPKAVEYRGAEAELMQMLTLALIGRQTEILNILNLLNAL